MNKKRGFNYGVIGVGSMGAHHARIISTIYGVKLAAVVDGNLERAKEIAEKYKAEAFENYKDILDKVDAVTIATPSETHFFVAQDIINAGIPCLVEKPLAMTAEQAQGLVDLSREKNVPVATGFIERFNPAFIELQKLIKGERILGIDIKRHSPFPARIKDANVIEDMMIHDLDLLLALLPLDKIEGMRGEGKKIKTDKLDQALATIYFESGIITKVSADRTAEETVRKIIVSTEKAQIEADLLNKTVYVRDFLHPSPSIHHTKKKDQLFEELTSFINSTKKGVKPKITAEDGLAALKLAEEVLKACS